MSSANEPKSKFRNVSKGIVGVTKLDLEGKPKGVPVPYNGDVWLSEQEEILTANAPRNEKDNPFTNGSLELLVAADQVEHERPIGSKAARKPVEQTPVPPAPPAAPPAAGEEQPAVPPEDVTPAAPPAAPPQAGASIVGTDEHEPQTRAKQAAAARQPTPEEIAAKQAEVKRQDEVAKAAAEAEAARQREAAKAAADAQTAKVAADAAAAGDAAKKPGPLTTGSPGNSADPNAAAQTGQPPAATE